MDPEPFRAIPKGIFILHSGFRVHEEWTLNPLGPYLKEYLFFMQGSGSMKNGP